MPFYDDNHDDDDLPSFLFRGSRESRESRERKVEGVQDSSSPYTKKYTDWVRKKKKQTSLHIDKKGGLGQVQEFRDEEPEVKPEPPKPEESKEIVKVSKKGKQDYQSKASSPSIQKAVDLREYQDGWDRLKPVRQYTGSQSSKRIQGKTLVIKDVYNYIGKRFYGENAVSQISVDQMANDLGQKPFRQSRDQIQLVIELLDDAGLIEVS